MYFWDLLSQIWKHISRHKLRSFLALFGITWGTYSMIMLLALSTGFSDHQKQSMQAVTNNMLTFFISNRGKSFHGHSAGEKILISPEEIMSLPTVISKIKYITPILESKSYTISFDEKIARDTKLIGVSASYPSIYSLSLTAGRFFNPIDLKRQAKVIVINSDLKNQLFANIDAVGMKLIFNNVPFEVIGVLESKNEAFSFKEGPYALIPYTTFQQIWGQQYPSHFAINTETLRDIPAVKTSVLNYFTLHHEISQDNQSLGIFDSTQALNFVNWFFDLIYGFFLLCGALTLAVGGIGVANIMFLIVNQRSKEIGLRMALGAETKHILLQIMMESGCMVLLGGACGFVLSLLTLLLFKLFHLPEWMGYPTLSFSVASITILSLLLVALIAGYFPARRATLLSPVLAMSRRN